VLLHVLPLTVALAIPDHTVQVLQEAIPAGPAIPVAEVSAAAIQEAELLVAVVEFEAQEVEYPAVVDAAQEAVLPAQVEAVEATKIIYSTIQK
jgi:hypothetical protein